MKLIYIVFLFSISSTSWAQPKKMMQAMMAAGGACYELDPSWTPQYGAIVAYWKLNGTGSIAAGASIPATVGTGAVAVNPNATGMSYASSKLLQGIQFDGVDDKVCAANDAALAFGTGDFTFALWLQSTVLGYQNLFSRDDAGSGGGLDFLVNTGNGVFRTWVGGVAINGNINIATGKWVHVTLARRSGVIYQYVNGNLDISAAAAGSITAASSACMGQYFGGGYPLNGMLDDVAVWNVGLTDVQIKMIYDQQSCGKN